MIDDLEPQKNENSNLVLFVTISVVIAAIIFGGGVYFWQKTVLENQTAKLNTKIISLESQIAQLQMSEQIQSPASATVPTSTSTESPTTTVSDMTSADGLLKVTDGKIYYNNQYRGYADNHRIYLENEGTTYSFEYPQGLGALSFANFDAQPFNEIAYYNDLTINLPSNVGGRYSDIDINYACDSSLRYDNPYYYCQTNGQDYLEQYEMGSTYRQWPGTGGGISVFWHKIYIKKFGNQDIVFEGRFNDVSISSDERLDETTANQEWINLVESKNYLDQVIKASSHNQAKEAQWQAVIDSFRVE
jgi:hypothetical protein